MSADLMGVNEKVVRKISKLKDEPKWMLEIRLAALKIYEEMSEPKWGPDLTGLDLSKIKTYVAPETEVKRTWEDVPKKVRETFDELGIPEAEQEGLAGVGAQYDSEMVYHNIKKQIEKTGVAYLPFDEAVKDKRWEKVVREYFGKLVSANEHKYSALHYAVHSGGTFLYIPKGVSVEIPIQSYYRFNAVSAGQFEHTLIIVDEGADLHFIEACSAPKLSVANLHAGCVELFVQKNARLKFSSVENWSKNMYNLNTKRAIVEEDGEMEWVTGNFGSKVSMIYPCTILEGDGARMEYTGVAFAGEGQDLDTGAKVIHIGKNTCSYMDMRGLSQAGGRVMSRSLVKVASKAENAKGFADCKSLILDEKSSADAVPVIEVKNNTAEVAHEASVGKLAEEQLRYLRTRGISEKAARALLVRGFTEKTTKELPVEYAMEMNNLLRLEMEGVG
ncbi:Fe-S cluster assembly protein SufB [Candidatus Saccharibacteria bacterium]|nr:Fe-S cluster assembly protein SufB [Candidatus Saccharibacteria bacterium]